MIRRGSGALCCLLLSAPLCAIGCGKEVARVSFTDNGNLTTPIVTTTTAVLDSSKDVDFWTELDVAWEGDIVLQYHIQLEQAGKPIAGAVCNPLDVSTKIKALSTDIGQSHTRAYSGKMRCSTTVPTPGETLVRVSFSSNPHPKRLDEFDLLVKQ
jgi:hypothetical protein